ncbi:MAG: rhodanese-like domain-containing protein [Limnoraphis robusta]|jgi:rhodanese-related sulfurtransferase
MSESFSYQSIPEITVEELEHRLTEGSTENLQLVDVREPQEVEIAHLEGFINLPLSEFSQWSDKIHSHLDLEKETLVMCHHGMRSAQMCQWLIRQGFTNVKNIAGGIDAYSAVVDPLIPRY